MYLGVGEQWNRKYDTGSEHDTCGGDEKEPEIK